MTNTRADAIPGKSCNKVDCPVLPEISPRAANALKRPPEAASMACAAVEKDLSLNAPTIMQSLVLAVAAVWQAVSLRAMGFPRVAPAFRRKMVNCYCNSSRCEFCPLPMPLINRYLFRQSSQLVVAVLIVLFLISVGGLLTDRISEISQATSKCCRSEEREISIEPAALSG